MRTISKAPRRPSAMSPAGRDWRASGEKRAGRSARAALSRNPARSAWRFPLVVLLLIQAFACSAGDTSDYEATASDGMELVGKTPDVVLDLAESSSGWTGSSTVSVSSERKQGEGSLTSSGTGQDRFRRNNLPAVDVRAMKYLTFWYFVSDASKIRTDRDAQIEISSHSSVDTEEMHWNVHSQKLRSGWNFVRLLMPGTLRSSTGININLAAVKRFRIYHFVSASVITRIDDIRFSNREPLEFATGCANATANRTLTGGGKFNQASGTSANGCSGSYVVDLNDYATAHSYGTSIAYGDAMPTTQAACENTFLRVGVWECVPGSTSSSCAPTVAGSARAFLGEVVARGVWLKNPLNQGICRRPLITLERHIDEFEPNGVRDFKIAVRGETTGATQRGLSFVTTKRLQSNIYAWDQVKNEINALTGGAIHPAVHQLWLKKGTSTGNLLCRSSQLDHTLMTFSTRSLTQLGATSANVTARNNAYAAMRTALCTTNGTEAALQTATRDFFSALINIRVGLADVHFATASALGGAFGDFQQYSVMLMADTLRHSMGLLVSNCSPSVSDLYRYETTGTLPAGVVADRALLGTCGNQSASAAATTLGVGGTLTPSAARTTLADCLAPSGQDVCNDPRAQPDSGGPDAGLSGGCFSGEGASIPCTTSQTQDRDSRRVVVIFSNENGQALSAEEIQRHLNENPGAFVAEMQVQSDQNNASRIELDKPFPENSAEGRLGNAVVQDVDSAGEKFPLYHTVKQVVEEIVNTFFEPPVPNTIDPPGCEQSGTCHPAAWPCPGAPGETRADCPPDDGSGGASGQDDTCLHQPCAWQGEEYCPPDAVQGGWYGASNSQYSDGRLPRQITQQDRIEHCLCQATDPGYAATGTPSVRASAMCPAKREQIAHYCLAAQWGPDDPIPAECLGELQPAHRDRGEWLNRICDKVRCPENQYASPAGDHCECIALTTSVLGDPLAEICRQRGWAARCEEGTDCVCGVDGYGDVPFNDPACLNDPATFPGSLDRISTPTPDRLLVFTDPRTPDDLFVGMRDDSTTVSRVVSAILPSYPVSTLPAIGTGVNTRLVMTEAATSGVFQLYLHNPANNVFHEFADQCELRTLTAGQPATCNLTPDNSQRITKWNDCFRSGDCSFELTVQATPAAFNGIVGFTAPVFSGALRPATSPLPPSCPRPGPDIFIRDLSPLWESVGGTPDAPSADITLGSGAVLEVPPTTFTIDPGLIRFLNPG